MYSFSSRVRFSETDETGYLSLNGVMNYLQDCCLFHSEETGYGPDYLKENHRLWLLSGWHVVIDRYPKMFEKITIGTIPYEFSGCFGRRNAVIRDEQGACIISADSLWVYVDTDEGKPARPDSAETAAYGTGERIPMEYVSRKISLPEGMQSEAPVPVLQNYIDSNHHINNAQYIEIALELIRGKRLEDDLVRTLSGMNERNEGRNLMSGLSVRELRTEYKKQAKLGEVLYPRTGRQGEWNYVVLEDGNGYPYSSVALRFDSNSKT